MELVKEDAQLTSIENNNSIQNIIKNDLTILSQVLNLEPTELDPNEEIRRIIKSNLTILPPNPNLADYAPIDEVRYIVPDNENMLKCLVIGDTHFKKDNVIEMREIVFKIKEFANKYKPDFIVCLGDILDKFENAHMVPYDMATTFLHDLSLIAPIYVLMGNHDRLDNKNFLTPDHFFTALKYWPNTTIVDHVIENTIKGRKFIFVPYVETGRFFEALQTAESLHSLLKGCYCIFAHQEFVGSIAQKPIEKEDLPLPNENEKDNQGKDKKKDKKKEVRKPDKWPSNYPLIISGHIHDYKEVQDNLIYIGTPLQHDFGASMDKTISTLEWPFYPDMEELFSETENGKYPLLMGVNHQRHDLNPPRRIQLQLTGTELIQYYPDPSWNSLSLIKILVSGTEGEIKTLQKHPHVKELKSMGVKIHFDPYQDSIVADENRLGLEAPTNHKLQSYVECLYQTIAADPDLLQAFQQIIR